MAIDRILQRYLLVWLVLLSLAAHRWPVWFAAYRDPFAATADWLNWFIAGIMFAVGWLLPRDEIPQVLARWPTVAGGTLLQYTSMPLLAWSFGRLFGLSGDLLVGILLVGCVPGAMASNVLTWLARGNTSYSISLTTLATLASPLVVPLTLKLALVDQPDVPLNMWSASRALLLTVVLPVAAGHLAARWLKACPHLTRRLASAAANLLILWLIAVIVGLHRQRLSTFDFRLFAALVSINLAGYAAGYLGGAAMRLPEAMRRALTIEIGMQNAGVGATLAVALFRDHPAAAIPPALYMFGCMLTGTMLAQAWRAFPPRQSGQPPLPLDA